MQTIPAPEEYQSGYPFPRVSIETEKQKPSARPSPKSLEYNEKAESSPYHAEVPKCSPLNGR
jgi:hypothetical protein